MRFMMLMIPKGYEAAAPGTMPDAKHVEQMMAYNKALKEAGILIALDGLHPPSMGGRVTFAGGKPKVTDGPFPETKEVLGGYWMIQVKSKAEALDWASRCPAQSNEMIEVRQVMEMSDFPEDVKKAACDFPDLQKKACASNPAGWFEIPVTDVARASTFYAAALSIQIAPPMDAFGSTIAFLPMNPNTYGSGGALCKSEQMKPSPDGVRVYFRVDNITMALERIKKAGGVIRLERTSIGQYGFIGEFDDTEGNRIGLHEVPQGPGCGAN